VVPEMRWTVKQFLFAVFTLIIVSTGNGQQVPENWNVWRAWWAELPVEEQLETYLEMYKTEKILFMYHVHASEMAGRFGTRLIPYLKEYVLNADFSNLRHEPKDITLSLAALIVYDIQMYTQPGFEYINDIYLERGKEPVDEADVKWFVEQYKRKIDEYILKNRAIDTTVYFSETFLFMLVFNRLEVLEEFDNIRYDGKYIRRIKTGTLDHLENYKLIKDTLKKYYEDRLSIPNLEIKPLEFTPVYME
jgi:hypothetical protein